MSYSQRLLQNGNALTRLSHNSRFSAVLDTLKGAQYTQALDYGCGDGCLLKTAYSQGIITSGIGVDVDTSMLSACQENFADLPRFQFCKPQEISDKISPKSCDLIVCTETLEHIGNPESALEQMLYYSKEGAKMVISVPLEIGPSLLFKQIGRYLADLKKDYGHEYYSPSELFAASIFWDADSFTSSHSLKAEYTGHKGFDYRKLERLVQQKVTISQRIFSPFPWFGNLLNSTIIWVCRVNHS